MQRELEELLEHITQNKAYQQTFRLTKALTLRVADPNWPESKQINQTYNGQLQASYQPTPNHTQHGILKLQNSTTKGELLIAEQHSNQEKKYLGVVAPQNDVLTTYVQQN